MKAHRLPADPLLQTPHILQLKTQQRRLKSKRSLKKLSSKATKKKLHAELDFGSKPLDVKNLKFNQTSAEELPGIPIILDTETSIK